MKLLMHFHSEVEVLSKFVLCSIAHFHRYCHCEVLWSNIVLSFSLHSMDSSDSMVYYQILPTDVLECRVSYILNYCSIYNLDQA